MKAKLVIYDGVISVIRFEEVLQRPWPPLCSGFYIVNLYGWQVNGRMIATVRVEKRYLKRRYAEHFGVIWGRSWKGEMMRAAGINGAIMMLLPRTTFPSGEKLATEI